MRNLLAILTLITILVLLTLASGCGFACGRLKFTSVHASDETLRESCERAADRYYAATGIVIGCDEGRPLRWGDFGGCAAGHTGASGIEIQSVPKPGCEGSRVADPDWPQAYVGGVLDAIVAHEIGHAIAGSRGGEHAPDGVMARVVYGGELLTTSSLEWLCVTAPCQWLEAE